MTRMKIVSFTFGLALLTGSAAGCVSNAGTATLPAVTVPAAVAITGCTTVNLPELLFPAAGATNVAQSQLQLWFGYPTNPSTAFSPPVLTPVGNAASIVGGLYAVPAPGPTPAGSKTPPPGDAVFVSTVATLGAGTTYAVSISNTAGCEFFLGTVST
jgi:hypothetical protein